MQIHFFFAAFRAIARIYGTVLNLAKFGNVLVLKRETLDLRPDEPMQIRNN